MVVETVDDFWQGSGTYVACMSCVVGCWYAIPLKFGAVLTAMAFDGTAISWTCTSSGG